MKVFDYQCGRCGHKQEIFTKNNNPKACKECGGLMLKMVSAPGMVKGNHADKARVR